MYTRIVLTDARARAKPCLRCGYSLRKIESLYCPECGLSAWLSLNGNDGLDASNPLWLSRLSMATAIMAAAHVFAAGVPIFLIIAMVHPRAFGLCFVSMAVGVAIYSGALLLLCVHERRYPDPLNRRRWATRVAAVVGLLAPIPMVSAGLAFVHHPNYLPIAELAALLMVAMLAAPAACTWWYLRPLAVRGFHPLLARLCRIMTWVPPLCLAALIWVGIWTMALVIVPWVYLLLSLVMLIRFSILFRRASKVAAANWAKETADAETKQPQMDTDAHG